MMSNRNPVHLPSCVTIAFFGLLLVISLILNIKIFLKIEETSQNTSSNAVPVPEYGRSFRKKVENGKVWVELPDPLFDAYFLSDKSCTTCMDINSMEENFQRTYPTSTVRAIDVSSDTGKELLSEGVTVVPAIIFSKSFESASTFSEASKLGIIAPVGEKYYEYRTGGNKKILNENQLPEVMRGSQSLMIVGYTDFFSPDSAAFSTVVPQIASQFRSDIIVKNNVLVSDIPSAFIAEAVQCGTPMQKIIDTRDDYVKAIQEVSVDKKELAQEDFDVLSQKLKGILKLEGKIAECYDKHEYLAKVQAIAQEAQSLGINGAPAFFVGNRFLAGPQSADVFSATIKEALTEKMQMNTGMTGEKTIKDEDEVEENNAVEDDNTAIEKTTPDTEEGE